MGLIKKDTLAFLEDIGKNNNRPWFASNKERYTVAQQNVKDFLADLVFEMNKLDEIERSKLFRIYRDVRFSKDKTPYNTHWSMSMSRVKPYLRGGYYVKISPQSSFIACGFWNPNPSDMALIRGNIDQDDKRFRNALADKNLKVIFGTLQGATVKTAPKGYSKDHPSIDLLRHKQFILMKEFSNHQVLGKEFSKEVAKCFFAVRPFFNYMSDILGHDLNGQALY